MPLPGDNLKEAYRLLREAIQRLKEKGPEADLAKVRDLIWQSADILQREETDIVRWGDITRLSDHTYEPYNSIKAAISMLMKINLNKLPKQGGVDIIECIKTLEATAKVLSHPIQERLFFSYL
ncbi:MAG: hypothetical protein J7619_23070 [Dyadobacter sp.]|uniref:hypothetical protein n=1 Tax=Dyadobacter sp. TaxID=1914288 RepID=UPI001B2B4FF1|nr:hypothetical protein [Dyadobacter sp.]MBO9615597.1 hypothetical protein [Dyadobacter sp.]